MEGGAWAPANARVVPLPRPAGQSGIERGLRSRRWQRACACRGHAELAVGIAVRAFARVRLRVGREQGGIRWAGAGSTPLAHPGM
eukprot:357736-Chlamydomonas_euryale.AAC.2